MSDQQTSPEGKLPNEEPYRRHAATERVCQAQKPVYVRLQHPDKFRFKEEI